jgi:hypothetical protein
MQISSSLPSCYVIWGYFFLPCDFLTSAKSNLVDQQFIFGNPSLLLIYLLLGLIFKFVLQFFGQKLNCKKFRWKDIIKKISIKESIKKLTKSYNKLKLRIIK